MTAIMMSAATMQSEKNNTLLAIFLRFFRIAWLFWN
jgi:hypothetical protein